MNHDRAIGGALLAAWLAVVGCGLLPAPQSSLPRYLDRRQAIPREMVKLGPETDRYPPILHSGEWEQPVPLPAAVNTAGYEDAPFITPDGSALYFFFTPDAGIPPERQLLDGVTGIYRAEARRGEWLGDARVWLQAPDKLALDGCPFILGDRLWFCSTREGYTGIQWFTAGLAGADWQHAGGQFPPEYEVGELHISRDGQELYFHSSRAGGLGGFDIWLSVRQPGGAWGEPVNLAAVNSPGTDGWPCLSADGSELWLTRMEGGTPSIHRSRRSVDGWTAPELILSQFAGEASLDDAGNLYFVHHYYDGRQMREADIYFARRKAP